ncbi:sulfurtransferase TusA family protein [Halanaerobium praevalens]|uniref:SirA-like domain-containing protein n=1 Tax=Halanaerobium praevalens (strain ATCC 33744 / DSM 2228 / GSL) TaxID=572479 RepID=E3DM91_HALPG|nr:sulfurtransferase TusA family protein [Halanaerobium praevalens]ADO76284.1 SirA-like domain-containing protein [Halanaerobium praevalens DSM 2228]
MKKVDARGRSCPEPVVMTKEALENSQEDLEILVGEEVAKENVIRFVRKSGAEVEVSKIEDGYKLIVK